MEFPVTPFVVAITGALLFSSILTVAVVRYGPRRGSWSQPAAAFRRPGTAIAIAMDLVGLLHLVVGVVLAVTVPGAGIGIVAVSAAMGLFYVLCGHAHRLVTVVPIRTRRRDNIRE